MTMNIQATPSPEPDRLQSGQRIPQARSGGWLRLFQGIRPVTRAGAVRDALAGFQLAAMNIPQALGYTKIAGMPVVTGFYTLLLPLLAFAVFGSSRYLVVAADSATASILAGKLATMAPIASARYVALASTVALLTAGFLLLARILKLGFLADFLSQTVLTGFLTGVGFQVGIAVLGEMVGLEVHSNRTVGQLLEIFRSLPRIHLPTVAISAVVVTGVFALKPVCPQSSRFSARGRRRNCRERNLEFRGSRHRHHRPGRWRASAFRVAGRALEGCRTAARRFRLLLCDDPCAKRGYRAFLRGRGIISTWTKAQTWSVCLRPMPRQR